MKGNENVISDIHHRRGRIHLTQSGGGGKIICCCKIIASFEAMTASLCKHVAKHQIKHMRAAKYRRPHVWVLRGAIRYKTPFIYSHPQDAVVWNSNP